LNEVTVQTSVEDVPLSERILNVDGIRENHGYISQTKYFQCKSWPNIQNTIDNPISFFHCIFSNELIDHLVFHTNFYPQQKQQSYEPLNSTSMKVFLAFNIAMSIKKVPSYKDYWSTNIQLRDKYISSLMPLFLFNLHINENNLEPRRHD